MILSIIIPAYNAANTIIRCLDSIYTLGLEEHFFEVIVIDDCSKDSTVECVERYASGHNNLLLLRQNENHRQGAARNRGVSIAKGKYIAFVDSDDETDSGILHAVKMMTEHNLDMVAMHYSEIGNDQNKAEKSRPSFSNDMLFSGMDFQVDNPFWCTAPWAYLYNSVFIKNCNYPFAEDVLYEDSDFVNVHLYYANRMMYCSECCYLVHYNSCSTTHTFSYKHNADYFILGTRMLAFYEALPDKKSKFADLVLEGGSYNIMQSFKKLPKLLSLSEIIRFYQRVDTFVDRRYYLKFRNPKYCWTTWTRFCLKMPKFK